MTDKIICSECGAEISAESKFCFKCGVRQSSREIQQCKKTNQNVVEENKSVTGELTKKQMNIVIGVLLVNIAFIWIVGASWTHTNINSGISSNTVSNTVPEVKQTPSITENSNNLGVFNYCTINWRVQKSYDEFTKLDGTQYTVMKNESCVVVDINIKNTGDQVYSIDVNDFLLFDGNEYYRGMYRALVDADTRVEPGMEASAEYEYFLPEILDNDTVGNLKLIYNGLNADNKQIIQLNQVSTIGNSIQPDRYEFLKNHIPGNSNQDGIFKYCTWSWQWGRSIGEHYTAPEGQRYIVVTVHIQNTGTQTYSTNPLYWTLTIAGIEYPADTATYDNSLNHKTVNVGPGGDITVDFAYLVNGYPTSQTPVTLNYNGPGAS